MCFEKIHSRLLENLISNDFYRSMEATPSLLGVISPSFQECLCICRFSRSMRALKKGHGVEAKSLL